MKYLIVLTLLTGCFKIENPLADDVDGDGLTVFDGDCDDNSVPEIKYLLLFHIYFISN